MTNPFMAAAQNQDAQNQAPAAQSAPAFPPAAPAQDQAPAASAQQAPPAFQPNQAQAAAPIATPSQPAGDPFATPSGGDGARIAEDLGAAVLVRPIQLREGIKTSKGETDAVEADWVVLDGANAGQIREGGLIFQRALVASLRRVISGPSSFLVGRIVMGEARNGNSAPYLFQEDLTVMDLARQAAAAYRWV